VIVLIHQLSQRVEAGGDGLRAGAGKGLPHLISVAKRFESNSVGITRKVLALKEEPFALFIVPGSIKSRVSH
jgi:hypothetical protein